MLLLFCIKLKLKNRLPPPYELTKIYLKNKHKTKKKILYAKRTNKCFVLSKIKSQKQDFSLPFFLVSLGKLKNTMPQVKLF